ncbi:MAG: phosphodiesterase [Oscillospiraceae bacterium]|nr:phosphodiesterase [Oscillospiraceae bacterium]
MKWLIASDIHGSAYYCRKVIECFEREGAERMLLLGDVLYHGPRNDLPRDYLPREAAAQLNAVAERVLGVRGNCDAEIDQTVLRFPIMADYALLCEGGRTVFATHGHLYNLDCMPPLHAGEILLHGHTHVPGVWVKDGIVCLNPGSAAIPKEGSRHSCMTLERGIFRWIDLDSGEEYDRY